jgi:hypothetical protein
MKNARKIASIARPKEAIQRDAKCDLQQKFGKDKKWKLGRENRLTLLLVVNRDIWSDEMEREVTPSRSSNRKPFAVRCATGIE